MRGLKRNQSEEEIKRRDESSRDSTAKISFSERKIQILLLFDIYTLKAKQ